MKMNVKDVSIREKNEEKQKNNQKRKEAQRRLLKLRNNILIIFGALNIVWLIVQVLEYFFLDEKMKGEVFWGIIFAFICTCIVIGGLLYEKRTNPNFKQDYNIFHSTSNELKIYKRMINKSVLFEENDEILLKHIEELSKGKQWLEVLEVGRVTSQLFKNFGRHSLRVSNAKYIKESIENIDSDLTVEENKKYKARLLIDDLGYSLCQMGDINEGERNIKAGLDLASEVNDYEFVSKAYRHLVGIELDNAKKFKNHDNDKYTKHIAEAKEYLKLNNENIHKVNDKYTYYRLMGFKHYTNARIHIAENTNSKALKELEKAEDYFIKARKKRSTNPDDSIRVYYWRGVVHININEIKEALENHINGYCKAKDNALNYQQLKNGIAICELCCNHNENGNDTIFNQYIDEVIKLAEYFNKKNTLIKLNKLNASMQNKEKRVNE